jgi:hypothetical protein
VTDAAGVSGPDSSAHRDGAGWDEGVDPNCSCRSAARATGHAPARVQPAAGGPALPVERQCFSPPIDRSAGGEVSVGQGVLKLRIGS